MACNRTIHDPSIVRYYHFGCLSHIKTDLKDSSPSRVKNTQGFVFAGGTDHAALSVPAHTVDLIRMHITQLVHQLTRANIPHAQYIITTWNKDPSKKVKVNKVKLDSLSQTRSKKAQTMTARIYNFRICMLMQTSYRSVFRELFILQQLHRQTTCNRFLKKKVKPKFTKCTKLNDLLILCMIEFKIKHKDLLHIYFFSFFFIWSTQQIVPPQLFDFTTKY